MSKCLDSFGSFWIPLSPLRYLGVKHLVTMVELGAKGLVRCQIIPNGSLVPNFGNVISVSRCVNQHSLTKINK